ncbi:hypothetical protein LPTSP2_23380 [Leptospira ellinghausenii]|uniref:histidine kinase n=1 Tax=Leptospira ellinghausenii TaxID=1917822 RepID=A0A2P2DEK1_9LEPT|nr:histidine kinase dimerization/phosphoacceptor domain -containing protein [Leptospira ellinghausenii]GBF43042.1 hypothetical protein LPTSP2_23380 [Leptospira ellinghausenii]
MESGSQSNLSTDITQIGTDATLLLELVGENYPNGSISLIDKDLRFIYTNGSGFKKFGIDPKTFINKSIFDVLQPEVYISIKNHISHVFAGNSIVHEVRSQNAYFLNSYKPIINENGKIDTFILTSQDITDFKNLEAEHEKLQSVVKNSINEIYIFDANNFKIEYINESGLKNLKYKLEEAKTKTIFDIKPNFEEKTFKAMIQPVLHKKIDKLIFETFNKRADGTYYPVEVHLQLIEHQGKLKIFTIVLDISNVRQYEMSIQEKKEELAATIEELNATTEELKEQNEQLIKLLDEKENLFKEIHHRIKNNLQMILSLLYIKSQHTMDSNILNFIQETKNRIFSISLLHEQLLQLKSINKLDVQEYFHSLIKNIMASYEVPEKVYILDFDVDKFELQIDKIVNLGLIINEIISNIYKHAYSDANGGNILVRGYIIDSRCKFLVGDEGRGGVNVLDTSNSYGTQLIKLFAEQLGAKLTIDIENGTKYTIEFGVL